MQILLDTVHQVVFFRWVVGDWQVLDQVGIHDTTWGHQIFFILFELVLERILIVQHQSLFLSQNDTVLWVGLFLFVDLPYLDVAY